MEKILLAILPYWDPMIPPMGIASLKAFLQTHGYAVKTVDYIVKKESLDFYNQYFNILKAYIPGNKQGNFKNIGHDVLQNHMMAYQNVKNQKEYEELVKILIYHSYYVKVDVQCVRELNKRVDDFYRDLAGSFLELLKEQIPDVLGVTAYKCTLPASLFVLKLARENYPRIKTLMGGGIFADSHARVSPNFQRLLETSESYLDKLIIGQGELLFLAFLQGELPDSKRVYGKEDIGGKILDFPDLDIPDFSDLDTRNYPCLAATASSSCKYQCSFCNSARYWGKYRTKDVKQIISEMTRLYKKYGNQLFFMTDALINPVITDLAAGFINSDISLYYDTYFKVDKAAEDIENTMLWRRGGLYRVRLGVESGSQRLLDMMNKRITIDQIKTTMSALAYAGIKTTAYWVIGHPGETEADFQQTLELVKELKNDIFQAECNPFFYNYSGQTNEDQWAKHRALLYPGEVRDLLVFDSWTLDLEPLREETYTRMNRFEEHCRHLGIPNPYSLYEHDRADERWKQLHKNAVPSLLEFKKTGHYIDENKSLRRTVPAKNTRWGDGDFSFY